MNVALKGHLAPKARFYLLNGGVSPSHGDQLWTWMSCVRGKTAWVHAACFQPAENLITSMDQSLFSSLLTLYCSWFSYVLSLFSSPPPPVSAQHSYKNGDPFISLPASPPAPLIIGLTHLWTWSKLSVYLGLLVSPTKTTIPGVVDD
jgi:hypothetical protein